MMLVFCVVDQEALKNQKAIAFSLPSCRNLCPILSINTVNNVLCPTICRYSITLLLFSKKTLDRSNQINLELNKNVIPAYWNYIL